MLVRQWKVTGLDTTSKRKRCLFITCSQGEVGVIHQRFLTPDDFRSLSQMFRNEGPIRFNTDGEYFITGPEPVERS